jgi:protein-tyrosine phosphatase
MKSPDKPVRSILFVCTGNVFRSVVAEYATRVHLEPNNLLVVGSAGIEAKPQSIHPWIQRCLCERGADVATHVPRRLTRELLEGTDLIVAMSRDHQTFIHQEFEVEVPLFKQVCYGRDEPILDLHEAHPNWEQDLNQAQAYVSSVIEMIWNDIPSLLSRLHHSR